MERSRLVLAFYQESCRAKELDFFALLSKEHKRVFSYESRTYFLAAVIFVFEARVSINLMGRQLIPVAVLAVQVSSSGLTKVK